MRRLGVLTTFDETDPWSQKELSATALEAPVGVPESFEEHVGLMYDRGQGVAKDHEEAARWYSRAADLDFRRRHLLDAVLAYQKRDRRYGGIKPAPVAKETVPVVQSEFTL